MDPADEARAAAEAAILHQAIQFLSRLIEDHNRVTQSQEYQSAFVLLHTHGLSYSGPFHDEDLYREAQEFVTLHDDYLN